MSQLFGPYTTGAKRHYEISEYLRNIREKLGATRIESWWQAGIVLSPSSATPAAPTAAATAKSASTALTASKMLTLG